MALSSTLNARELKNNIEPSTTQLATSRCSRMVLYLLENGPRIAGNDEADVTAQGGHKRRFVDHVREHEEQEGEKWDNG